MSSSSSSGEPTGTRFAAPGPAHPLEQQGSGEWWTEGQHPDPCSEHAWGSHRGDLMLRW